MRHKERDPLAGPLGILGKFVASFLFGCLVSAVILCLALWLPVPALLSRPWAHMLWIIPAIWGVIGIFWFDQMLDLAKDVFHAFFNIEG